MPTASSEGLLTAGTWAVPAHPLPLPAASWIQRTAPAELPNPATTQGTAAVLHQGCSSPLFLDFFFQSPNRPSIFVASRKNNINSGAFPSNSPSEKLIISTGAAFNQHQSLCAGGRRAMLPLPPAAPGSCRQGGDGLLPVGREL